MTYCTSGLIVGGDIVPFVQADVLHEAKLNLLRGIALLWFLEDP